MHYNCLCFHMVTILATVSRSQYIGKAKMLHQLFSLSYIISTGHPPRPNNETQI